MPDYSTDPKLTSKQRCQVMEWLCEGLRNNEILDKLKEQGVEVTQQAINYYRTAYADEIDEAREKALKRAVQQGFANRLQRIALLERNAKRAADLTVAGGKGWTNMSAELRAILKDIRDELGDLKQRHEHTGAGGGPVEVETSGKQRLVLEGDTALAVIAFHEELEEDGEADSTEHPVD